MKKEYIDEIRNVYDEEQFDPKEPKEMSEHYFYIARNINNGRKVREKETGEHFDAKYKMFIVQKRGFVSNYEGHKYGGKCSGKRHCFDVDEYSRAIKMNIEEVINCISDCANSYCNWRYKIVPEDEFLKEYEEYKIKHIKELSDENYGYGFQGEGFDIDNILHQPKRKRRFEWGCLTRGYYGDRGLFGEPLDAIPYYSLYCDSMSHTSIVIDYKKTNEGIAFETRNSIYVVKKLKGIDYIDQLKEFDDFKKSKHYKELLDFVDKYEDAVMKNIMYGKKYID